MRESGSQHADAKKLQLSQAGVSLVLSEQIREEGHRAMAIEKAVKCLEELYKVKNQIKSGGVDGLDAEKKLLSNLYLKTMRLIG